MPYLDLYLKNLNREKNEIHLVYWNRDEQPEDLTSVEGIKLYEFKCYQEDEVSKLLKIKNFLRFKKYVKSILKENFDYIIVLQTVTAVLLCNELLSKRFKDKYIYDYRDYTYECVAFYKCLVKRLVNNSKVTFVSSKGFKKYLPDSSKVKYIHNIISDDLKKSENMDLQKISSDKLRIGFWGFLREEQVNSEIIKKVSKDQRFELHYYGREQKTACNLKDYVLKNKIENVFFHGEYNPEEKYEFLKNTDIIHNIYCEEKMLSATSNKYYDGVIFKRPQLVANKSFMAEEVIKKGLGIAVDPFSESFTQDIYSYFQKINACEFGCICEKEKSNISEEMTQAVKELQF